MTTTRVVVADDHRSFAAAVTMLLDAQPDLDVVATVHDADEAERAVTRTSPDVLVIDVDLDGRNGLDVVAAVRDGPVRPHVVVVTAHQRADLACAALRLGAAGYITKDAPMADLLTAIRGAAEGEVHVAPRMLAAVLREMQEPDGYTSDEERALATLTAREVEVLACLEEGLERAVMAERLFLSVHTVRTHTRNLLAKLHVHSSLEAVAVARRAREARAVRLDPSTDGCVARLR